MKLLLVLLFSSVFCCFGQTKIFLQPKEQIIIQYQGCKKSNIIVVNDEMDSLIQNSKSIAFIKYHSLDSILIFFIEPSFRTSNSFKILKSNKEIDSLLNSVFSSVNLGTWENNNKKNVFINSHNRMQYFHDFNSNIFEINAFLLSGSQINNSYTPNSIFGCFLISKSYSIGNLISIDLNDHLYLNIYADWCFEKIIFLEKAYCSNCLKRN